MEEGRVETEKAAAAAEGLLLYICGEAEDPRKGTAYLLAGSDVRPNPAAAMLPGVTLGELPGAEPIFREIWLERSPVRSSAAAIARLDRRRRSHLRQPPHSDGGRAGPAAVAAAATAGDGSGGTSGGWRGPVTRRRPRA